MELWCGLISSLWITETQMRAMSWIMTNTFTLLARFRKLSWHPRLTTSETKISLTTCSGAGVVTLGIINSPMCHTGVGCWWRIEDDPATVRHLHSSERGKLIRIKPSASSFQAVTRVMTDKCCLPWHPNAWCLQCWLRYKHWQWSCVRKVMRSTSKNNELFKSSALSLCHVIWLTDINLKRSRV